MTPPRRSPRLQNLTPHSLVLPRSPPPPARHPRRPRTAPPPRKRARPPRPTATTTPTTRLLDLPDGPLTTILTHLGATATHGTLRGPRDAFTLAQTNTRLLALFRSLLMYITPDVANAMPATLSPRHMLSITRLSGLHLREIVLPSSCGCVLRALGECPNLRVLSFVDGGFDDGAAAMRVIRRLPLRVLKVCKPSPGVLRSLPKGLEEVSLTMVSMAHVGLLAAYLRTPPRRLTLVIEEVDSAHLRDLLIDSLREACPKMSEVSVTLHPLPPFGFERDFEIAASEAAKCMRLLRGAGNTSECKSMKLRGCSLFRLLLYADRNAKVELSSHGFTFGDDGDGLHVLRMPLCFEKPSCDLSRLREVFHNAVFRDQTFSWRNTLSNIDLKFAHVESLHSAKRVGLRADVVEIPFWCLCRRSVNSRSYREKYWNWLSDVREVRLIEASHLFPRGAVECFLKILAQVLDECHGEVLWIEAIVDLHVKYQRNRIRKIRPAYRAASAALRRYEERGGDAGTVRAVLGSMRWTGSPDYRH